MVSLALRMRLGVTLNLPSLKSYKTPRPKPCNTTNVLTASLPSGPFGGGPPPGTSEFFDWSGSFNQAGITNSGGIDRIYNQKILKIFCFRVFLLYLHYNLKNGKQPQLKRRF